MNIKYSITFVVLFALNMLDARAQQIDTIVVDDDCRRMVQFFKATLYENYVKALFRIPIEKRIQWSLFGCTDGHSK